MSPSPITPEMRERQRRLAVDPDPNSLAPREPKPVSPEQAMYARRRANQQQYNLTGEWPAGAQKGVDRPPYRSRRLDGSSARPGQTPLSSLDSPTFIEEPTDE